MESKARLVIVGAGIVGCSIAYHLAQKGWRDMVIIDKGPLYETGGSTSHAPGLVFQTNSSKMMTDFANYTVGLLSGMEWEGKPCWYPVGGVEVAYTDERMAELKRKSGYGRAFGMENHIITPEEVQEHIPLVDPSVIKGGIYIPSDGDAKAWYAAGAMAKVVEEMGAGKFYGGTELTDMEVDNGRVTAVITNNGRIECEDMMLCTNIWSQNITEKIGVNIPLMSVEHQYLISEPLEELAGETREIVHPILRHQDFAMYFRQHGDAYGIGNYKHEPRLVEARDIGRDAMRPFTPEDFDIAHKATDELLPAMRGKDYPTKFNGMFSFTIDGAPIMGASPTVDGLWFAVGVWVTHSGGVGKAMAELMTDGVTEVNIAEADIARFHPHAYNPRYIRARSAQQYREVYDIIHPKQQMLHPRELRLSPYHARLVEQGGHFHESSGWEVAQWYEGNAHLLEQYGDQVPERDTWASKHWSPIEGAEHIHARENVALFNLSAFVKVEVSGPGACEYLQWLAANNIDKPEGKVVYTALLDKNGGIRADLTVTRLGPDRFLVLTGAGVGMRDLDWIQRNAPTDGSVTVQDVTSRYCTIGMWGPKARDVLAELCYEDVSNEAFPYFSARSINIGNVPVMALRLSYVGEPGWEFYAPVEYGLQLWDILWEAGEPHNIIAVGGGAFDSLRLEKGYRLWGADIHTEYNPYEAGIGWAVRMKKGDFLGRDALVKIKADGVKKKLTCMTLDDQIG
ncbi:MAG: FAD-dependent oxidoreductase, partial [Chloroflexota bacterium]